MRSSSSNQYSHPYNNHDMSNTNRGRHSHHHPRYNNPNSHAHSNYNSNRSYQPTRNNQHHSNNSQYPRTSNSNSSNPRRTNHNHHHSHSHNNNHSPSLHHRTHNQSPHSSRPRNNHHNISIHRPYQHNQHNQHPPINNHNNHNNNNRSNYRNNRRSNHRNTNNNNRPSSTGIRTTANRSRNIRIYTSHNYPSRSNSHTKKPVINLVENKHKTSTVKKVPVPATINIITDTPSITTNTTKTRDNLSTVMSELSFDNIPFKYDYKSKLNLSLLSLKNGGKMAMDPTQIYAWKYTSEEERKTQVRHYMLPCLKLLNSLQCMDDAIDFICAPNDMRYNPDYYQLFSGAKTVDKNMCFEWICNLLKSDYYETVDDFAIDIRLIFENTFKIFGYKHEWSKNCRVLQVEFEKKMILISREIPNAKNIFIENGNPSNDILQKQYLELDENKKEIDKCLKKLEEKKSNQLMNVDMDMDMEDKKNENEKKNTKTAHQKYLSNIDTKNIYRSRKRATKQTLKQKINNHNHNNHNEYEEGEVIMRLDENKLDECDVWFDFVNKYGDNNTIERVMMIQEGFANKNKLELKGNNLNINIRNKSAEIQNKIYKILESAQKKMSKKKEFSLNILTELFEKKKRRKEGKIVEDPYSNVVIERKKMELKLKQDEERKQRQLVFEKQEKEKIEKIEEMDEDSDEFFDTLHLEDVGMNNENNNNNNNNNTNNEKQEIIKITNSNFNHNVHNVLSKDNYSHNTYKPIMPSNVDVDDIAIQRQTSDDKYKQFSWKNQQGQEEIDF